MGMWHKEEKEVDGMDMVLEGWLPAGTSQNDLEDGDFAWVSDAYKAGKTTNKAQGRKLPFKIHGKVNRDGWKAAWKAAAHPGARHPDFSGGPGQEAVLATLRRYKPRGITINKDSTFTDTAGEESCLSALSRPFQVLEETEKGLRYRGVALVDDAISSNDRYYSAQFNNRCMEATNRFMLGGGIVTIYSRHGKALGAHANGMPTELPVGKVTEPLTREGSEIWYTAFIAPTTEGKDAAILIKSQVLTATSIRAQNYESRMRQLNGRPVEEMVAATIAGIDLADEAGIAGAGIREILEEAPQLTDIEEGTDMDIKELTAAQLALERPDLLAELTAAAIEPLTAQVEEMKPKVLALETANAALETEKAGLAQKLADIEAQLAGAGLTIKVAEAAHIGTLSRSIYEALKAAVKTEADIPAALRQARSAALVEFAAGVQSGDTSKGVAKGTQSGTGEAATEEAPKDEPLTEEFKKILALSM